MVIPARLRHGSSWSDACILNVSSRGMMIHTGRPVEEGTEVEIRRGEHAITARVVWRDGGRAGLRAEERVPIEDLLALGRSSPLAVRGERRRRPRREESFDIARVVLIAAFLAAIGLGSGRSSLARPLAIVADALDR